MSHNSNIFSGLQRKNIHFVSKKSKIDVRSFGKIITFAEKFFKIEFKI